MKEALAEAEKAVKEYINETCKEILECTAIFKNTEIGQEHLDKFVKYLDL